jgi:hypothetical protein
MILSVLDNNRQKLLPSFAFLKNKFYLAGGTALALHLGHRESIDFDFFSQESFDPQILFQEIKSHFTEHVLTIIQEEKNTLTIIADEEIKLSFFTYSYPLLKPLCDTEYFQLADILDIACMKCSAIVGRATKKDYVDFCFLLEKISLAEICFALSQKMPELDENLVLKSLVYFDDIPEEEIVYLDKQEKNWENVQRILKKTVALYRPIS